ncbi:Nodulin-like [Arabidopsis thaliana x Arabidopsis arenosa]|uniref:Nodulin-like n=1 Tax=Arabidopsis thaliana x Arabidopsis arenosa TaxID=1240361 RepID=A0A8T1ZL66_9BRAS|nr:Nodulin-like [Arabidopsis thaliana x Arabidopsis arenosa]
MAGTHRELENSDEIHNSPTDSPGGGEKKQRKPRKHFLNGVDYTRKVCIFHKQQMARLRGCHVDTVLCWHRLLFGSISPVIKSSLNYNQKELSRLGVAKDLGDSVGFIAGTLSEILPLWAALLVGAVQNLSSPVEPRFFPMGYVCSHIRWEQWRDLLQYGALVSGVQNFPRAEVQWWVFSRLLRLQLSLFASCSSSDLLVVTSRSVPLMEPAYFHIRCLSSTCCLSHVRYAYSRLVVLATTFFTETNEPDDTIEEPLVPKREDQEPGLQTPDLILSEVEDEKPKDVDLLPASERHKRIAHLQAQLMQAAAEGAEIVLNNGEVRYLPHWKKERMRSSMPACDSCQAIEESPCSVSAPAPLGYSTSALLFGQHRGRVISWRG